MAYIANKPVRFDRTYAIGEVIPETVIDPKMIPRLIDMGRIISVDLPTPEGSAADGPPVSESEGTQNGAGDDDSTNTPAEDGPPEEGEDSGLEGGEFICPECGKAFGSKNALSAHSRSHKE